MKKILLMSLALMFTLLHGALAQTRSVSGRVTDQATGSGLPGVTVLLKGTSNGVSTSADGAFTLTVPETGGTLVFSSIGMTTQERAIGSESSFSVALSTDTKQLTEVIVTGYGAQQERRDIIGSIASVKSSDYKDQPIIGVDQALQGRAAGVQVIQNSGTPGGGISVRVRGAASIGASNEPLYVVDGLPVSPGNTSQLASGGQLTNGLNDINPNDIESIEVLKDAASAAIYGSRASNGVVLITTKRGKSGKARVDLDYYSGAQTVWKKPQVITGEQQTQLFLDAAANRYPANANGNFPAFGYTFRTNADLAAYIYGPGDVGPADANGIRNYVTPAGNPIRPLSQFQNPSTATNSDFVSKVLRTAPISNYGVTFSGGNDASRFRLAVNYFDQQGTIVGSGFKRGSARLSVDNKLSDKVRMGTSIGITQSNNNRINNDNSIYGVLTTARLYATDLPIYNADGTYYKNGSLENPIAAATEPIIKSTNNRLIGSQYTEFELIKNLKYRATFGLDYTYGRDDRFYSTLTNAGASVRGEATLATLQDLNFNHISAFNYSKTFAEDHTLSALLVFEYQRDSYSDAYSQVTGFPSNTIRELSAGATKVAATSSSTGNALFGTLAKLDYSFKGRYLLGASVRRDQGSRFGADNQVGYFPAVSAGWRVLDEAFLKDQTAVSELKLRGSFGETGNQPSGNFGSRGLIGPGANYLDQGGLALTQLANPNLKWERTQQTNVGIDLGFLQNRFYISADVYQRKTTDLLLAQRLPNDTGFPSYSANIGSIQNKGVEFALTTINFRNEGTGFNWETNFNISFNRNEVTKLSDQALTGSAQGFSSRLIVGQPLGAFYGYRVDHIFQNQEEINKLDAAARLQANNNSVFYQGGSTVTKPGDIMFKDISGPNGKPDGRITADDQEIIGTAQPKFYGGITNTVRFMNFDFSAFLQYNVGAKVFNASKQYTQGMSTTYSQDVEVLNRWTPTNTSTDIPRAVYGDPNQNNRNSDRFLEDGSFARFKSVSLGYTLPSTLAKAAHVRSVRVYASAQNLVTFTKYTGLDPEVNTSNTSNTALNTDFFTFPQARTITGGVTLGF
ncbi:TonB-dependent receptor [Hymenobacter sp. BT770]|uniref:SusC/RagA family TonB-linked outer membrane protein n=1 Tax=Hymenobacter sp. BT770 TaxID=2886942 RepID=UPI001D112161|nr:TonB-dependent receptor [Hymenobacter sp. BT770]MCC3152618.1 TonB-dependent receptor [Hymenobacter sp. BT770]MDO3414691.1 TonB-dependent receptor [Hymenobacter sp. BT770]